MKRLTTGLFAVFALFLFGCQTPSGESGARSQLTHGNVQLTLKKGITTQAEILEKFGGPNVATVNAAGEEVWTYERHATVSRGTESDGYATVLLLGGSRGSYKREQSSRTMTLIIKFGPDRKVSDFKSMYSAF